MRIALITSLRGSLPGEGHTRAIPCDVRAFSPQLSTVEYNKEGRERMSRTEVKKERTLLSRREWLIISASFVISLLAGVLTAVHANAVLVFVVAAGALSLLAALVGQATDQIGARLGSGATGVLQSALGNLPELFVGIFALRAGLIDVVQA